MQTFLRSIILTYIFVSKPSQFSLRKKKNKRNKIFEINLCGLSILHRIPFNNTNMLTLYYQHLLLWYVQRHICQTAITSFFSFLLYENYFVVDCLSRIGFSILFSTYTYRTNAQFRFLFIYFIHFQSKAYLLKLMHSLSFQISKHRNKTVTFSCW